MPGGNTSTKTMKTAVVHRLITLRIEIYPRFQAWGNVTPVKEISLWREILATLQQEHGGTCVYGESEEQKLKAVKEKWKSVEKAFRKYFDAANKSGQGNTISYPSCVRTAENINVIVNFFKGRKDINLNPPDNSAKRNVETNEIDQ